LAGFYVLSKASSAIRDAGIEPVRIDLNHCSFLQVNSQLITYTYYTSIMFHGLGLDETIRIKNFERELSVFSSEEKNVILFYFSHSNKRPLHTILTICIRHTSYYYLFVGNKETNEVQHHNAALWITK
jgi:hypothetical protein